MNDNEFEYDGWEVIKSGKYLVQVNRPHLDRVLAAKRAIDNQKLIAELASYADQVRPAA